LVIRKGEVINERLASMLSKLGIKPVESGLAMSYVFDEGLIVTKEQLKIDLDATKHEIQRAYADSFALSLGIDYPMKENIETMLQIAHLEAHTLAIFAEITSKETIEDLIRKAHIEMLALSSRLPTLEEKTAPPEKS
jgi:large subunit ribosomal protein L10